MNQFSVALVIVAVLAAFVQAGPPTEEMKAVFQKCIAAEGATTADVEALEKHSHDLSKQARCTIACSMKEFGVLSADGKLVKEPYMKHAEIMSKGDANALKQCAEIYDKCQGMGDADLCEAAYKYAVCIETEAKARGIADM